MAQPNLVVVIEGGIVREVIADQAINVRVIDFDIEGCDNSNDVIIELKSDYGSEAYVYQGDVFIKDASLVNKINAEIARVEDER